MNLIIDIGNSSVKYAVVRERNIITHERSESPSIDILEKLLRDYPEIDRGIMAASGEMPQNIYDFLMAELAQLIRFTSETPTPVINRYKTPATLGSDRLAGAVGVNFFFPDQDILLFDFGTALTIDFICKQNEYLGGNISPGLQLRFNALHRFTARLPLCTPPEHIPAVGGTTQEAIEAGVVNGMIAEVLYYINEHKECKVVFTGGDAFYLAKKIKIPIFVVRNPVIYGLNEILKLNVR